SGQRGTGSDRPRGVDQHRDRVLVSSGGRPLDVQGRLRGRCLRGGQRGGRTRVRAEPPGSRQLVVDGPAGNRVAEAEGVGGVGGGCVGGGRGGGGPGVRAEPPGSRQLVVDGPADNRVAEAEVVGGVGGPEEIDRQQLVERGERRWFRLLGNRRDQLQLE